MPEENKPIILIVDDEPAILRSLEMNFKRLYKVLTAHSGPKSLEVLEANPDVFAVIMDIKMPGTNGIEAARAIRKRNPDIPVIFHTAYPGDYAEQEIDASESPFEYVEKLDSSEVRLERAVRNAVEKTRLQRNTFSIIDYAEKVFGMIGESPAMQDVFEKMKKLAPTGSTVLLKGETGTGKRTAAMALHHNSHGRDYNFINLRCDSLNGWEFEEIIRNDGDAGKTPPANFGASGTIKSAIGGTLFLEEIGNLEPGLQARLVQVMESGKYLGSGADTVKPIEIRYIFSTDRDLEALIREGRFREDLYYLLNGVVINFPPLRERRQDIPRLVEMIKSRTSVNSGNSEKIFDPAAIKILCDYDWPGNIRQLANVVSGLIHLSTTDTISADDVAGALKPDKEKFLNQKVGLSDLVRNFEKSRIMETLQRNSFNISAAARDLLMDRANLRKKIKYYKITLPK